MVSDWESGGSNFANLLMGIASDVVSPYPLIDPPSSLFDHPANSQSMGLNYVGPSAFDKLGLTGLEGPSLHGLSQFPSDSAFVERAARFSCFSNGAIADVANPFGSNQHPPNGYNEDTKQVGSDRVNSGGGQEETEPAPAKGIGTKKRKRGGQDTEQSRQKSDEDAKDDGKRLIKRANRENGKQSSQNSDPPKEEYIHMRARRGQATNSHSLAERVRREKISERMKFLQDLVPGCSKVTGKAVMLDEIINYVQSLQRQVEFLSMKLATVNPRLDFNIESLLAKDQMYGARGGPPMGFSSDMPVVYPQLHSSQPAVIQPNLAIMRPQSTNISERYKEPTPQGHNLWDDELHNIVQMGFNSSTSPDNRDPNSSLLPDHTKVKL